MDKRKRWKGLIKFMPAIALGTASLFMNGVNEYIFGVVLLIASSVGCAEALLGWTGRLKEVIE